MHRGDNPGGLPGQVRIHLNLIQIHLVPCHKGHLSYHSVPVALCLIGDTVRVEAHIDHLQAVVNAQSQSVFPRRELSREVVFVRGAQAVLPAQFHSVQKQARFSVNPFQKEAYRKPLPVSRDVDLPDIPCHPDIMLLRGEHKRDFDIARFPEFCQTGGVIKGTVVHTPGPGGLQGDVQTLAPLGHRAREIHGFRKGSAGPTLGDAHIFGIHTKLPGAVEWDGCRAGSDKKSACSECKGKKRGSVHKAL